MDRTAEVAGRTDSVPAGVGRRPFDDDGDSPIVGVHRRPVGIPVRTNIVGQEVVLDAVPTVVQQVVAVAEILVKYRSFSEVRAHGSMVTAAQPLSIQISVAASISR